MPLRNSIIYSVGLADKKGRASARLFFAQILNENDSHLPRK